MDQDWGWITQNLFGGKSKGGEQYLYDELKDESGKIHNEKSARYKWHKEHKANRKNKYDPNPDKIDFQGSTYGDIKG